MAAVGLPGNWREIQILRLHSRLEESETLEAGPSVFSQTRQAIRMPVRIWGSRFFQMGSPSRGVPLPVGLNLGWADLIHSLDPMAPLCLVLWGV